MDSPPATSGNEQELLFRKYVVPEVPVLYSVALSLTRRPPDAEDLVQDTLLRAFRAIERFDGSHPRAWLLTIMRNAQLNRTRRRRPTLMHDPDATLEQLATGSDGSFEPEALVVDAAFTGAVADAYGALPEQGREVVHLVDLQGLSYAEAAGRLGVPVGTVMSRLHRARQRIRRSLEHDDAGVAG